MSDHSASAARLPVPSPDSSSPADLSVDRGLASALAELQWGDFQSRWSAAKVIASFGEAAIAPLLALLQEDSDGESDDWELTWFIARTLGNLEHPAALNALVNLIQSTEHEDVAGMAATALAGMGAPAIAPLCTLLQEELTHSIALQALTQIRHPDIIPPLLAAVGHASPTLRAAALNALSDFQHPDISAALLNALSDPVAQVRHAAVIALGLQSNLNAAPALVQQLRPLLWDLNLDVCQQTAIALGRIGTPAAVAALLEVLQSPHTPAPLQTETIRAIVWVGTPTALEGLANLLFANPPAAYSEALSALGRVEFAKPQAAAILLQLLQTQQPIAQSPQSKQAIALSLGQLGQIEAIDPLIELLADENASIRFHAIAALKQLEPQIAYEKLQALAAADQENLELQRGVAIALQEWG
ncbi:HEAT repeat domain-containing protein [Phormidium tenue FACHB-886]|nr:HEAT repeat domain-containing protein [Phormidium tenue FACHB-886]